MSDHNNSADKTEDVVHDFYIACLMGRCFTTLPSSRIHGQLSGQILMPSGDTFTI